MTSFLDQVFAGDQVVDQAAFEGEFGGQGLSGEDDLEGLGQADEARQPGRAAPGGEDAELGFRKADLGRFIGRSDPIVASQAELVAAAHTGPVDGRHRRDGQRGQPVKDQLAEFDQAPQFFGRLRFGHLGEIGASDED